MHIDDKKKKKKKKTINYAINAINPAGNLTINNESNYKFSAIGTNNTRGVLRVFSNGGGGHAVVNGGYYTSGNVEQNKETFFNHYGNLELNHVNAYGTILLKNYGGTMTVIGGNISTADKEVSAVLVNEGYGDQLNTNGIAVIEIRGATIKNSSRGLEVKSSNIILKDVTFENNTSDIYLNDDQELTDVIDINNYNGKPLSEAAQAEKWAVESGLMQNDAEGNFNGAKKMNKLKALRTLDAAKKLG